MPDIKKNAAQDAIKGGAGRQQGHYPLQPGLPYRQDEKAGPASFSLRRARRPKSRLWLLLLSAGLLLVVMGAALTIPNIIAGRNRQRTEAELQTLYNSPPAPEALSPAAIPPSPLPTLTIAASAQPQTTAIAPLRSFATRSPWAVNVTRDRFLSLRRVNKDIAGWLSVEGVIDLPVVQRDNAYYLTHDFYRKASPSGTLFLDENYGIGPPSENLLIHGHNMRDGSMFGSLYSYTGRAFYKKHWLVTFETLYEKKDYAVFAAFTVSNEVSKPNYFRYAYNHFDTDEQFTQFANDVKARSVIRCGLDILPSDSLLMLSTCRGADQYFVVIARKIRDGEAQSVVETTCLLSAFR